MRMGAIYCVQPNPGISAQFGRCLGRYEVWLRLRFHWGQILNKYTLNIVASVDRQMFEDNESINLCTDCLGLWLPRQKMIRLVGHPSSICLDHSMRLISTKCIGNHNTSLKPPCFLQCWIILGPTTFSSLKLWIQNNGVDLKWRLPR